MKPYFLLFVINRNEEKELKCHFFTIIRKKERKKEETDIHFSNKAIQIPKSSLFKSCFSLLY